MAGQGQGKKLSLVVAMCNNRGIGINGKVPWRIRGDMEFFKTITTVTQDEAKKNAVIMGRKTWDSIPSKFRPLPGRVNIVLSRTLEKSPEGAHVVKSWDEAMELVNGPTMVDQIEHVFIVGGSAIYEMALASPACYRVYLTRVLTEVECDTFFPTFNNDSFKLTKDESIDDTVQKENNLEYKIEVYEKV